MIVMDLAEFLFVIFVDGVMLNRYCRWEWRLRGDGES